MNNQTQYISPQGLEDLKAELQERKTKIRREIADKNGQAKELGDLSENFEYHDAKQLQAENESRIIHVEDMLRHVVVVEKKTGETCVSIGTGFVVDIDGQEKTPGSCGRVDRTRSSAYLMTGGAAGTRRTTSCSARISCEFRTASTRCEYSPVVLVAISSSSS